MSENTNKDIDKEKAEQQAIEKENKILSFLLPIVGGISLILGVMGIVLTVGNQEANGIFIFSIIIAVIGVIFAICGVFMLIRRKNPNFLKRKSKDETDTVVD